MRVTFKCPNCKHDNFVEKHDRIDARKQPELRKNIISSTLFDVTCEKCGASYNMDYPCLYEDHVYKLAVYYRGRDGSENPFGPRRKEGWQYRVTDSFNRFREKILIREKDLNDKAVEIVKMYLLFQYSQMDEDNTVKEMLFETLREDQLLFYVYLDNDTYLQSFAPFAIYDDVMYRNVFGIEFDEVPEEIKVDADWLRRVAEQNSL